MDRVQQNLQAKEENSKNNPSDPPPDDGGAEQEEASEQVETLSDSDDKESEPVELMDIILYSKLAPGLTGTVHIGKMEVQASVTLLCQKEAILPTVNPSNPLSIASLISTLKSIHKAGVLHGDICLANLCATTTGEAFIVNFSHAGKSTSNTA
ncbi:hypothetical protein L208DRAFT_1473568 [Tricholoma matsutake]|nr:hypothetical protein L208DRAFT_1473568 [Tricholoma matsutake 945]